jgi:hypothetical protein
MQLFSADDTMFLKNLKHFFSHENIEKLPSKVAHNQPNLVFQYCQLAQNLPNSHILFHKKGPRRKFCVMTLSIYLRKSMLI